MPGVVLEKQINSPIWKALKAHILKERQRKKQEQEANAEEERLRSEREKKYKENVMTLEETKEQISNLELRLSQLKEEKHQLFLQLKKVLNEDETRKRQQLIKESSEMLMSGYQEQWPCSSHPSMILQPYANMSSKPPVSYKIPVSNMQQSNFSSHSRSPSPPVSNYQSPFNFKTNQSLIAFNSPTPKAIGNIYYGVPNTLNNISSGPVSQPAYGYNNPNSYSSEPKSLMSTFLAPRSYINTLHPQLDQTGHKMNFMAADYVSVPTRHSHPAVAVVPMQSRGDPKTGSITHGYPMKPVSNSTTTYPGGAPQRIAYTQTLGRLY